MCVCVCKNSKAYRGRVNVTLTLAGQGSLSFFLSWGSLNKLWCEYVYIPTQTWSSKNWKMIFPNNWSGFPVSKRAHRVAQWVEEALWQRSLMVSDLHSQKWQQTSLTDGQSVVEIHPPKQWQDPRSSSKWSSILSPATREFERWRAGRSQSFIWFIFIVIFISFISIWFPTNGPCDSRGLGNLCVSARLLWSCQGVPKCVGHILRRPRMLPEIRTARERTESSKPEHALWDIETNNARSRARVASPRLWQAARLLLAFPNRYGSCFICSSTLPYGSGSVHFGWLNTRSAYSYFIITARR